jgi:integrase
MPSKRITDAFVRNVRVPPKPQQINYFDTMERGLALVLTVSYGGSRTFSAVTYDYGKPRYRKLGKYPSMMVKQAREAAREYWVNPQKYEAQAAPESFKQVAEDWIKRHVEANKLRSAPEIKRILNTYVYPRWKDRRFLEIGRREVNKLLDEVADDHGPSQADATLAIIRSVMIWQQGRTDHYVCPIVRAMRKNKNGKGRDRILNDDELRSVWKACDSVEVVGVFVKLLLLTAQRRDKVATMKWADLFDGTWIIATQEREKGNAGSLKLPQTALDLINTLPQVLDNPHLFAGRGTKSFNHFSQAMEELRAELPKEMPRFTLHDLRRTARSLISRAGVRPHIAERVLGHVMPGVEGVYDRHSYSDEKADALSRLADLIETIINPPAGNVIPFERERGIGEDMSLRLKSVVLK